jgi:polysaccharide deacetylase family protein (PEP-CTERM system associated)
MIFNAISFDVEDYFQVSNFEKVVREDEWGNYESRVERNVDIILAALGESGTKATFFVLGWIAERYPGVVRAIATGGHELASHGYRHKLIYEQTPEQVKSETDRAIKVVEDLSGQKVLGYRAASFSIVERSLWALDLLQDLGLRYDSSVFPVRHPRYGIPTAPRAPYEIRQGFWEFPAPALRLAGLVNIPFGGGGYFRLYPYRLTATMMRAMNGRGAPIIVYLHPWEFDPGQPRIECSLQARFRHYNNLRKTGQRLRRMCSEFKFTTARTVLGI